MKDVLMRLNEAVKGSVLSESELAKDLGKHRATLNRYLNGHVEMPANILVGILNKLGLRLDELMAEQSQAPKVLLRADEPSVVKQPFLCEL